MLLFLLHFLSVSASLNTVNISRAGVYSTESGSLFAIHAGGSQEESPVSTSMNNTDLRRLLSNCIHVYEAHSWPDFINELRLGNLFIAINLAASTQKIKNCLDDLFANIHHFKPVTTLYLQSANKGGTFNPDSLPYTLARLLKFSRSNPSFSDSIQLFYLPFTRRFPSLRHLSDSVPEIIDLFDEFKYLTEIHWHFQYISHLAWYRPSHQKFLDAISRKKNIKSVSFGVSDNLFDWLHLDDSSAMRIPNVEWIFLNPINNEEALRLYPIMQKLPSVNLSIESYHIHHAPFLSLKNMKYIFINRIDADPEPLLSLAQAIRNRRCGLKVLYIDFPIFQVNEEEESLSDYEMARILAIEKLLRVISWQMDRYKTLEHFRIYGLHPSHYPSALLPFLREAVANNILQTLSISFPNSWYHDLTPVHDLFIYAFQGARDRSLDTPFVLNIMVGRDLLMDICTAFSNALASFQTQRQLPLQVVFGSLNDEHIPVNEILHFFEPLSSNTRKINALYILV